MLQRNKAALTMRANAERLREIASIETALSSELIHMARLMDEEAARLEAETARDRLRA